MPKKKQRSAFKFRPLRILNLRTISTFRAIRTHRRRILIMIWDEDVSAFQLRVECYSAQDAGRWAKRNGYCRPGIDCGKLT